MKLELRDAETGDLPEIKHLTDDYISCDFYSMDDLDRMLHGERNLLYVVTDADRDHAIVSYFYAFLAELDEALRRLHVHEKPEMLRQYGDDTLVGVYKASSTEKEYRKQGICSSFVHDLEPVFQERGAKMLLATALHPIRKPVPMRHIFRDNGFTVIADLSRPWADIRGYCPYCKQDPCICDGVFYMKKIDDTEGEKR